MYVDLVSILERAIDDSEDDWDNDGLHASDTTVLLDQDNGGKCHRALWYRLESYDPIDKNFGEKLMLDHGNKIHERISSLIKEYIPSDYSVVDIEKNLTEELPNDLIGHCDFVMTDDDGNTAPVEIKTQRGRGIQQLSSELEPKESHKLQLQTYLYALESDQGYILYVDREGQNGALQFEVEPNDERVEAAVSQLENIREMDSKPDVLDVNVRVRENKGPDSVYVERPWQCDYCDFKNTCETALPDEFLVDGIVAKIESDGQIDMESGNETTEAQDNFLISYISKHVRDNPRYGGE